MKRDFEYVVVDLGPAAAPTIAWGSAQERTSLGMEQFTIGHDWGASRDLSRIARHSYHTPGFSELAREPSMRGRASSPTSGESSCSTPASIIGRRARRSRWTTAPPAWALWWDMEGFSPTTRLGLRSGVSRVFEGSITGSSTPARHERVPAQA